MRRIPITDPLSKHSTAPPSSAARPFPLSYVGNVLGTNFFFLCEVLRIRLTQEKEKKKEKGEKKEVLRIRLTQENLKRN